MYNKNIYISRRFFVIFIFCIFLITIGIIRSSIGYLTPDEKYFLFGNTYNEIQYLITARIMSFIYSIHPMFIIICNLLIIICILNKIPNNYIYKNAVFLFLFPSVLFFTATFLRDIYIFLAIIILIYLTRGKNNFIYISISLICLFFLKYEFVMLILIAYILSSFRISKGFLLFIILFIIPILLAIIFRYDIVRLLVFLRADKLEDVFSGYIGLYYHFDYYSWKNFTIGAFYNFLHFHIPYILCNTKTNFEVIMKIDSFFTALLLVLSIFSFNKDVKNNYLFKFSIWMLILSFPFSLIQSRITSAIRYSLPFKPFIFYLSSLGYMKIKNELNNILLISKNSI